MGNTQYLRGCCQGQGEWSESCDLIHYCSSRAHAVNHNPVPSLSWLTTNRLKTPLGFTAVAHPQRSSFSSPSSSSTQRLTSSWAASQKTKIQKLVTPIIKLLSVLITASLFTLSTLSDIIPKSQVTKDATCFSTSVWTPLAFVWNLQPCKNLNSYEYLKLSSSSILMGRALKGTQHKLIWPKH